MQIFYDNIQKSKKGVTTMLRKKIEKNLKDIIIKGAEGVAKLEVNSTSPFISYQPVLPEALKKLDEDEKN